MKHYFLWMNFYYGNTQIRAIVFVFFNGNEIYAYIENINISSYGSESRINMEKTEKQKNSTKSEFKLSRNILKTLFDHLKIWFACNIFGALKFQHLSFGKTVF